MNDTFECRCGKQHKQRLEHNEHLGDILVYTPPFNWHYEVKDENGKEIASGGGGACTWDELKTHFASAFDMPPEQALDERR